MWGTERSNSGAALAKLELLTSELKSALLRVVRYPVPTESNVPGVVLAAHRVSVVVALAGMIATGRLIKAPSTFERLRGGIARFLVSSRACPAVALRL